MDETQMNHVLIYLLNESTHVNFTKATFDHLFKHVRTKMDTTSGSMFTSKPFIKTCLFQYHNELICHQTFENSDISEICNSSNLNESVYRLTYQSQMSEQMNSQLIVKDKWKIKPRVFGYDKTIYPMTAFPSTCKIADVELQQRITFKINNRLYLNFACVTYESDKETVFYHVYFNYHNVGNTDYDKNIDTLNRCISLLNEQ